ncbi:unnamed protein product [Arabidopsis thaliana]|uniref:Emb/CAB82975.1 n=3 Tax=Arabidopsis TaxID=3701 RepID=Q9FGU5_ARATH|nr:uncharacterized protein AT5G59080 [Arabidopsis thaliana]NP_200716.1 uncharacterized protein AT5G59080 [Arabidopsis thaliana]KAG7613525.1 hypothetical protein ISN44_As05g054350 [Arabidopsis suecica]AAL36292.1 unknown protein [Arabidopsis thaliana]AAM20121.1 unknown protein [Arabidopsis thaliana]AED97138.1 hypothetical protein AT5G59080 [Arabidopsis thaliana]ANM69433.1 hypothetical protein AT5G59080 [Arabidopsis thaliana]|eukprot:NP_001318836.1 hypothetical protein AT5G59080 [Arabidopsis thaliana]
MEGKGRVGSSSSTSSSFTAELFGSKDPSPPSSSSGIFSTMFPHPSKGSARDGSNSKHGSQAQRRESLNAQEDRVEPCHLSSSLYYGGQDVYARSTTNQTYPPVKNDRRRSGEDDANGQNPQDVSRGNWWQGSLYY